MKIAPSATQTQPQPKTRYQQWNEAVEALKDAVAVANMDDRQYEAWKRETIAAQERARR